MSVSSRENDRYTSDAELDLAAYDGLVRPGQAHGERAHVVDRHDHSARRLDRTRRSFEGLN